MKPPTPFHPGLQTAAAGKIALGMQETKGVQPAIRGFWAQLKGQKRDEEQLSYKGPLSMITSKVNFLWWDTAKNRQGLLLLIRVCTVW